MCSVRDIPIFQVLEKAEKGGLNMAKGLHKNSLRKVDNPHQWMIDDARMELIQQIKAEVEREREICNDKSVREKKTNPEVSMYYYGKSIALCEFLSFLSDLEKSEKPINQYEDFRGEMREWVELMVAASFPEQDNDFISEEDYRSVIKQTARHFAQWQKEQTEKRWLEDRDGCFWDGVEEGKKAMREQMLKEAVDAEVVGEQRDLRLSDSTQRCLFNAKLGDWLKIIIVKED